MQHLVLLPGMMCDERMFAPQLSVLSGTYNITTPAFACENNIETIAKVILESAPKKFILGGLSMGGIVAMEILKQAPEQVTKLVLMDTNPKAEIDFVKQNRESQITKANSGQLLAVMRDEMKPNYLADGPNKSTILDLCMEMAIALGPKAFECQSRALQSRPDYQSILKNVKIPTLILCGKEDRLCPVERHQLMHKLISGSQLEIIEEAGHLPTLEQPEKTNALIKEFLES